MRRTSRWPEAVSLVPRFRHWTTQVYQRFMRVERSRECRPLLNVNMGFSMPVVKLHKTVGVKVGHLQVGGGAPIVVQSMTMTDTADVAATARQCVELAEAGSEMVRVTVNTQIGRASCRERV